MTTRHSSNTKHNNATKSNIDGILVIAYRVQFSHQLTMFKPIRFEDGQLQGKIQFPPMLGRISLRRTHV